MFAVEGGGKSDAIKCAGRSRKRAPLGGRAAPRWRQTLTASAQTLRLRSQAHCDTWFVQTLRLSPAGRSLFGLHPFRLIARKGLRPQPLPS